MVLILDDAQAAADDEGVVMVTRQDGRVHGGKCGETERFTHTPATVEIHGKLIGNKLQMLECLMAGDELVRTHAYKRTEAHAHACTHASLKPLMTDW